MKRTLLLAVAGALLSAVPASWGEDHITICHFPPGNPANVQVITIGSSAVPHHIANHAGDDLFINFADGACGTTSGGPG
jgi:hypothetical protein